MYGESENLALNSLEHYLMVSYYSAKYQENSEFSLTRSISVVQIEKKHFSQVSNQISLVANIKPEK